MRHRKATSLSAGMTLLGLGLLLFLLGNVVAGALSSFCHDQVWDPGEFCGYDALWVTGKSEMNHDCVVDYLDWALFENDLGQSGPDVSGDLNGTGIVDAGDVSLMSSPGDSVLGCVRGGMRPDSCGGALALSFSSDPNIIDSVLTLTPFTPDTAYVVVSDVYDLHAIEFGLETSANVQILNAAEEVTFSRLYLCSAVLPGALRTTPSISSPSVVLSILFWVLDGNPAWMRFGLNPGPWCAYGFRWAEPPLDRNIHFLEFTNVGINGGVPAPTTPSCPEPPTNPNLKILTPVTDDIVLFQQDTYDLSGTASDPNGTVEDVEFRVNGGPWQLATGTTNWLFTADLSEGSNLVEVRARDNDSELSALRSRTILRREGPPQFILEWGTPGSNPGQFSGPGAVAVTDDRMVFVTDVGNSRVQKFDANGEFLLEWGAPGSLEGQFNNPFGVDVDADGNVYVVDNQNHRIQKFDRNGNFIMTWGSIGSGNGQFSSPSEIGIGPDGSVYVSDAGNSRIQKFDPDGNFILKWGTSGSSDGQFSHPNGVAVDGAGNVYVADSGNARVQVFNSSGGYLAQWGTIGSGDGEFYDPTGIVATDGWVYVADYGNHRMQRFQTDGFYLVQWGALGTGEGEFDFPVDVDVDTTGAVYVVDYDNDRIQKFGKLDGATITSILDIGYDQGGAVRISFDASRWDVSGSWQPILQYEAFRRVDLVAKGGQEGAELERRTQAALEAGMFSDPSILAAWDFVAAVPAHAEPNYSMIAPTLADSTLSAGMHWSVFRIRAATADPLVSFDSKPDSGYSLDNLAPNAPQGFQVTAISPEGDVQLEWLESEALDFAWFSLYRGTEPDFAPSDANRIAQLTESLFVDAGAAQGASPFYKLTAQDFSGNEGEPAIVDLTPTGMHPHARPLQFAAYPVTLNPVSGMAVIAYELPIAAHVTLQVYDVRGRLVRTHLGGQTVAPGWYRWEWDRTDESGSGIAAGIYFVRFSSQHYTRTMKLVVLR